MPIETAYIAHATQNPDGSWRDARAAGGRRFRAAKFVLLGLLRQGEAGQHHSMKSVVARTEEA